MALVILPKCDATQRHVVTCCGLNKSMSVMPLNLLHGIPHRYENDVFDSTHRCCQAYSLLIHALLDESCELKNSLCGLVLFSPWLDLTCGSHTYVPRSFIQHLLFGCFQTTLDCWTFRPARTIFFTAVISKMFITCIYLHPPCTIWLCCRWAMLLQQRPTRVI